MLERSTHLKIALRLEGFTVAWTIVEAIVSVALGLGARSIALMAFGLDSGIETFAAIVMYRRLRTEIEHPLSASEAESHAVRWVRATFLVLALYVVYEAGSDLAIRSRPAGSVAGIALAAIALIVMVVLGRRKARMGQLLGSRALLADSTETYVCAYLSAAVLAGVALNTMFGWWWADPVAALALILFLSTRHGRVFSERSSYRKIVVCWRPARFERSSC